MLFLMHAVVLTLYVWCGAIEGIYKSIQFDKITPQNCGPRRLNSSWVDKSRSSCAVSCLVRFPKCHGFMYNDVTKLCTPSSGLSAKEKTPLLDEGDLYFSDSCQSYPDFSIQSNQSTQANVAYYNQGINYTNAKAACECMTSHLYVAYTLEKFWLLYSIKGNTNYAWIGLDDMAVRGRFVWADSGQEIDSTLRAAIFEAGQPSGGGCVYLGEGKTLLDDGNCSLSSTYICEKPICS